MIFYLVIVLLSGWGWILLLDFIKDKRSKKIIIWFFYYIFYFFLSFNIVILISPQNWSVIINGIFNASQYLLTNIIIWNHLRLINLILYVQNAIISFSHQTFLFMKPDAKEIICKVRRIWEILEWAIKETVII